MKEIISSELSKFPSIDIRKKIAELKGISLDELSSKMNELAKLRASDFPSKDFLIFDEDTSIKKYLSPGTYIFKCSIDGINHTYTLMHNNSTIRVFKDNKPQEISFAAESFVSQYMAAVNDPIIETENIELIYKKYPALGFLLGYPSEDYFLSFGLSDKIDINKDIEELFIQLENDVSISYEPQKITVLSGFVGGYVEVDKELTSFKFDCRTSYTEEQLKEISRNSKNIVYNDNFNYSLYVSFDEEKFLKDDFKLYVKCLPEDGITPVRNDDGLWSVGSAFLTDFNENCSIEENAYRYGLFEKIGTYNGEGGLDSYGTYFTLSRRYFDRNKLQQAKYIVIAAPYGYMVNGYYMDHKGYYYIILDLKTKNVRFIEANITIPRSDKIDLVKGATTVDLNDYTDGDILPIAFKYVNNNTNVKYYYDRYGIKTELKNSGGATVYSTEKEVLITKEDESGNIIATLKIEKYNPENIYVGNPYTYKGYIVENNKLVYLGGTAQAHEKMDPDIINLDSRVYLTSGIIKDGILY